MHRNHVKMFKFALAFILVAALAVFALVVSVGGGIA